MRKNITLVILTLVTLIDPINAQQSERNFEIFPSAGYLINGRVQFVEGTVDFKNGNSFGLSASAKINSFADIEVDYTWAAHTNLEFISNATQVIPDFSTESNIHHLTLNTINYLAPGEKIKPFINLGAGAAFYVIEEAKNTVNARFALTTGLGCKYFINDKIGIRFQGRIIAPLHYEGVGYYASIDSSGNVDSGLSLNATAAMFETDFRIGVIIKL